MNRILLGVVAAIVCLLASHTAGAAEPVRIVATDAKLDAPMTIRPGLRHIIFENHGKQIHEAMFLKLAPGKTIEDFRRQINAGILFPNGAVDYSGAGLLSPGEKTEVWLPLDPGNYVLMCWNHMRSSMRGVTVADGKRVDDTPPKEDAVLRLSDFKFELQGQVKPGTRVIKVQSLGPSLHEADLFRLHPGHSAADVVRWYKEDLGDPAPADALGGVLDSNDLQSVRWLRRSFTPGQYVFHCATPMSTNAKSGEHSPTHADMGMVMTFDVAQ
jgi:uncharacterized cupredoxin-like copper-binding protein